MFTKLFIRKKEFKKQQKAYKNIRNSLKLLWIYQEKSSAFLGPKNQILETGLKMYKNIIIKFLNNTPTFQTPDPST